MRKTRTEYEFVAERLIHAAEAIGLSRSPGRREIAERYKKVLERELAKDLKREQEAQQHVTA